MLIVLFLAALAGTFLGLWLKRRHKRKQEKTNIRDTMLATEDAKNHLRNKHPDVSSSMSHIQIPSWDGSVLMSGANSKAAQSRDGVTTAKGKAPAGPTVRETDVNDEGPASQDEERHIGFAQSLSSKLKKKGSKSSKSSKKSRR
jgi:hypothetical protein